MIQVVVLDVDGVVIKRREMYFTERLARDRGVPFKPIASFVERDLPQCMTGRADLKMVLKKYLPLWGWRGSVVSLMRYWFSHEATVDRRVLGSVAKLRRRGVTCYLATDNEKYRLAYLLHTVGLHKHFDGVFCSSDIGALKSDPRFWRAVRRRLKETLQLRSGNNVFRSSSVIVWDDGVENIRAARAEGFQARVYRSFETYEKAVKGLPERAVLRKIFA